MIKKFYRKKILNDKYIICTCNSCKNLLLPFLIEESLLQRKDNTKYENFKILHKNYLDA